MNARVTRRLVLLAAACWLATTNAARGAEPLADTTTHRARAGDTVPRLSWFYRVRADAIRAANPQQRSDALTPGEVVVIPLAPSGNTPPPAATVVNETPAPAARRAGPALAAATAAATATTITTIPPRAVAVAVVSAPPRALPASPAPLSDNLELPSPSSPLFPTAAAYHPTTVLPPRPAEENETDAAPPPPSHGRVDFLAAARRLANQRIAYNGDWTPPGQRTSWTMDCSNTARWLYQDAAGLELPRTASDQYESLRVAGRLWETPRDDASRPERLDKFLAAHLQPGDLLFWENTYQPVRHPDITHVMIFLGRDAAGRLLMAGSQGARGVNIYPFDPHAMKGGYSAWFGLVHRHGRFVAYGRPLGAEG
ncbi:MAG: C40 family peptidase [Verrucomicrobia bacterium]|nr:C40 family peptidase [Verrucomicrobiota bacterium]